LWIIVAGFHNRNQPTSGGLLPEFMAVSGSEWPVNKDLQVVALRCSRSSSFGGVVAEEEVWWLKRRCGG